LEAKTKIISELFINRGAGASRLTAPFNFIKFDEKARICQSVLVSAWRAHKAARPRLLRMLLTVRTWPAGE
jgi:hypothetical protein